MLKLGCIECSIESTRDGYIFIYFIFQVKHTDEVLNKVEFPAEDEAVWGSG